MSKVGLEPTLEGLLRHWDELVFSLELGDASGAVREGDDERPILSRARDYGANSEAE